MKDLSKLPSTRYAKSGNVHVAYQVFGEGNIDLVFVPGFISNIENYWEEPSFARWLRKLTGFSRVITFDKRGTGLSDRVEVLPTMDERMDDVRAVMDATGSKRAAVFGLSEGGSLATLFAAHFYLCAVLLGMSLCLHSDQILRGNEMTRRVNASLRTARKTATFLGVRPP